MKYTYSKNMIKYTGKKLTMLDKLVIDFISYLNSDYVIVSGYIAILLGRSRTTEDVDLFIVPSSKEEFLGFVRMLFVKGLDS